MVFLIRNLFSKISLWNYEKNGNNIPIHDVFNLVPFLPWYYFYIVCAKSLFRKTCRLSEYSLVTILVEWNP